MKSISPTISPRANAGFISVLCLFFLCISALVVSAVAMEAVSQIGMVKRYTERDKAECIAEAGVDYGMSMYKANSNWTGTSSPVSFGAGTFSVSVSSSGQATSIVSTGTLPTGTNVTVEESFTPGPGATLPTGCLVANGDIHLSGNGNTTTDDDDDDQPAQHVASARCNGDFTGSGNMYVDGSVQAHGVVIMSGNAHDYDSQYPHGQSGAPAMTFPSYATNTAWQNQLISQAQAGGATGAIHMSGGSLNLTAPIYINGGISLSGRASLTITGPGVVYVAGSVSLSGQSTLTNGGVLAASGTFAQSGGSSYSISGNPASVGLISFASSSSAIQLTGGSGSNLCGLAYAANGGISMSGNGTLYGALVAAGPGATGSIMMSGNGTVQYPTSLMGNNVTWTNTGSKSWLEL